MFGSKSSIGVDIGSNQVKVCQLKRAGADYELEKVGVASIYPSGERPADAGSQTKAKIEAVKRAIAEAKITVKNTVSAVSGESIIVRYLQLPKMPEDELKKALQWEAEEYIPFRLDEVNLDSSILGVNAHDPEKLDVLLVSAKKDLVQSHVSILREAGLSPQIVEVDSFAFLNCYETNYGSSGNEAVALINLGAEITGICIYHNGVSRFSRDIPIGGNTMTTAIRSRLRNSFTEAEQMKIATGASPPIDPNVDTSKTISGTSLVDTIRGTVEEMAGYAAKGGGAGDGSPEEICSRAVGGVLNELMTEVRRSIEFFENQIRDINVAKVILGGGTAILPNLRENFEQELSLPAEIIDPLRRVRPSSKMAGASNMQAIRHNLAVGIGLGIRGLVG